MYGALTELILQRTILLLFLKFSALLSLLYGLPGSPILLVGLLNVLVHHSKASQRLISKTI